MTDAFDVLAEEIATGPHHPVIGTNLVEEIVPVLSAEQKRRTAIELPAYLVVQSSWFAGFGLQMVLFAYLAANVLKVSPELLGYAQMSLTAPSIVFILFGGVLAERADGRFLLALLHGLAWAPAAALGFLVGGGHFTYWMMIVYAIVMGTIGAFMMPARDAILNEIVARRQAAGSKITLPQGVAIASLVQFAAQLAGLYAGGFASQIGPAPLLYGQAAVLAAGLVAAMFLCPAVMFQSRVKDVAGVFTAIRASIAQVSGSRVLGPMVLSTFAIGVFVIGSFLVVLPFFARDVYGGGARVLSWTFIIFWLGAFCSTVVMTRFANASRPGAVMLIAQGFGALCVLGLTMKLALFWFLALCFVWGLAAGVSITLSRSIVQSAAPRDHLARVLAIYQLGFVGGAPIGALVMGLATHRIGLFVAPWIPAIGLMVVVLLLAFRTPLWRMRAL